AAGSDVFFVADNGANGVELWKTSGTGNVMVKDICPGTCSGYPSGLRYANGILYFQATDLTGGQELWRSDGTDGGTFRVADIVPGPGSSQPSDFRKVGSKLYFTAYTPETNRELYAFDLLSGVLGDVDGDGDVDILDVNAIVAGRNTAATGPSDPRDVDHNGVI